MGSSDARFGEGETLEHELVVAPRKGSVTCVAVSQSKKSIDNNADLFTKALGHDSIKRH